MGKKSKKSVLEIVTERVIETLGNGQIPWGKTWGDKQRPKNFLTGHTFSGINLMLLNLDEESSNLWASFSQLKEAEIKLKKGSKGQVALRVNDDDKLRFYKVFNLDQCDLSEEEKSQFVEKVERNDFKFFDEIYSTMGSVPKLCVGSEEFSYCPEEDQIKINPKDPNLTFKVAHELIHSTGHSQRLGRDLKNKKYFTENDFSFEELVADVGAYYLLGDLGKEFNFKENKEYAKTWAEIIKENPRFLIKACSAASKAVDYIEGVENISYQVEEKKPQKEEEISEDNAEGYKENISHIDLSRLGKISTEEIEKKDGQRKELISLLDDYQELRKKIDILKEDLGVSLLYRDDYFKDPSEKNYKKVVKYFNGDLTRGILEETNIDLFMDDIGSLFKDSLDFDLDGLIKVSEIVSNDSEEVGRSSVRSNLDKIKKFSLEQKNKNYDDYLRNCENGLKESFRFTMWNYGRKEYLNSGDLSSIESIEKVLKVFSERDQSICELIKENWDEQEVFENNLMRVQFYKNGNVKVEILDKVAMRKANGYLNYKSFLTEYFELDKENKSSGLDE